MMNGRAKIPLTFSVLSRSMSSGRTKLKNHYKNLEIDEKATQSEIKSAYFKLSMKYHPDKNSSDDAKDKFQNISEAYEVLGNYDKRRQYDRGMQIRTSGSYSEARKVNDLKPQDIKKEAYRARAAVHRSAETASMGKMYDFDTWTKTHYGMTFKNSQKIKLAVNQEHIYKERLVMEQIKSKYELAIIITVLFTLVTVFTIIGYQDFDQPSVVSSHVADDDSDIH